MASCVASHSAITSSDSGNNVRLTCARRSHVGTLRKVGVAEKQHSRRVCTDRAQLVHQGARHFRVDPPQSGAAPSSERSCGATQNFVATQLRFGHSYSCTLQLYFRIKSVKVRPRRATLTRRESTCLSRLILGQWPSCPHPRPASQASCTRHLSRWERRASLDGPRHAQRVGAR